MRLINVSNSIFSYITSSGSYGSLIENSSYNIFNYSTYTGGNDDGVRLSYSRFNIFKNVTTDGNYGYYLDVSHNNSIFNAYTDGVTRAGINLLNSDYNNITNSVFENSNHQDVEMLPQSSTLCHNILTNVTGSNKQPIVLFNHQSNYITGRYAEILLCQANYTIIDNVTIFNRTNNKNRNGINLFWSNNVTIANSSIEYGLYSIFLYNSDYARIYNNRINVSQYGLIYLISSDSALIYNNNLKYNDINIGTYASPAIELASSSINSIIYNNTCWDGWTQDTDGTPPVKVSGTTNLNFFNNSVIGNNWTNVNGTGFSQTCLDSDVNGICDTYYNTVTGTTCEVLCNNTDYRPIFSGIYSPVGGGCNCSCPSINTNWNWNLSCCCNITSPCDIGSGYVSTIQSTSTCPWTITTTITASYFNITHYYVNASRGYLNYSRK
jgi:hypothetical protein